MKVRYRLKELYPGIYLCTIKDVYELAMTFCRVQEYYESPLTGIRNKQFTLIEFMHKYSKQREGVFTYAADWEGFNVPGNVVAELYRKGIKDYNYYDEVIHEIHVKINSTLEKKNNYYLIGSNGDKHTIAHELCHGFYFVDTDYKNNANRITKNLTPSVRNKAITVLKSLGGYHQAVMLDELQAYLATEVSVFKDNATFNKAQLKNLTSVALEHKYHLYQYLC